MGRTLKILLVEDHSDDALLFQNSLKESRAKVIHVTDSASAMKGLSVDQTRPDIIVLAGTAPEQFLDWAETEPSVKKIPICIYTSASIIKDRLKKRVRAAFLKKDDPAEIRATVQEMSAYCEWEGP